MTLKIIYRGLLLFTLFLTISFLPRVVFDYDPTLINQSMFFTFVRILLIFVLIIELTRLFYHYVVKGSIPGWSKNVLSFVYVLLFFFLLFEGVFMFIAKSHFAGLPLCSKIWFYRYWKPINSFGFRDKPIDPEKNKNIMILGDSFTAGHGLKKTEDRYSNVLESKLIKKYSNLQVINLGINASDTKDEFNTLNTFIKQSKIKPDFIVLQYFGNDIEKIAKKNGIVFSGFNAYSDLPHGIDQLVKSSYFFNYIYWVYPHANENSYLSFLRQAFHDKQSLNEHLRDLDLFIDFSQKENTPLLILIFPFMQNIDFSEELYIKTLASYLKTKKVLFIDVSTLIKDIPVSQRIINSNDGHSSSIVNLRVAEAIYSHIQKNQIFVP